MAEQTNHDNLNTTRMEATTKHNSKVNQIAKIVADQLVFIFGNEPVAPLLEQLEQSGKAESVGILKVGDPPKSLAHWQGRVEEIEQLHQLLANKNIKLIGIEGIGGTGKSMLAAKIYEEIEGFPKRFWADVSSGAIIFSDLAQRVLTDFGYQVPEEELELVNALVRCLRLGKYLLVIDNLESLLKTDGQWKSQFYSEFFRAWIESGKESKILVTTREKPDLREFEWLHLKGLKKEEGASLLRDLGIKGEVEAFAELVDGHPLLLKIVADLIKDEYPQDPNLERLADLGLGNLRELLTDPRVVGQHRRENVRMVLVLDASFERLRDWQKIWLQNVSVYRGAFDAEAAIAMLPQPEESCPLPVERREVEQELRKLVKRSLLEERLNHKRQFAFQPVVLEYVRYKAGDQAEAHRRAIDYYSSKVKEQPWQTIDDLKEYLEIFYHWCQLGEYDSAFDAILPCDHFLTLRGYYTVQVELYGQLVAAWQQTDARENWNYLLVSLISLGNAYRSLGKIQTAIEYHQQSLEISRELGDRSGEAISLGNLGNAYSSLGKIQTAIDYNQQSLEIKRELGDRSGEAHSLGNLGAAYGSLGKIQTAIDYNQQSLEISRELGDRQREALSLNDLGSTYAYLGKIQTAIEFYQQSLEIFRSIGDRGGEGNALGNLGNAYCPLRQFPKAIEFSEQSLEITRELGDRQGEARSLNDLGAAYCSLGQYQTAIDYHQQALEIFRSIGERDGEGNALGNLGCAYADLRQYQTAIDYYQQSLEIFRSIGERYGEAISLSNLGCAYADLRQYQTTIDYNQQALEITREIGNRDNEARSLGNLGNAYRSLGQYQTAIEFYQQSLEIKREIGDRSGEVSSWFNLVDAYRSLGQYPKTIEFHQQSLEINREIGYRHGEARSLGNLGNAYADLGQYQTAIDYHQQALEIARKIKDRSGEGNAWFNLGDALSELNQKSDAIDAYRNARQLYEAMGLDSDVQICDEAIERLSQQ